MKRFLKGFLWNFVILLLVFSGFRAWTEGPRWFAIICFAVVLVVAAMRFMTVRQRLRDQNNNPPADS